MTEAETKAAKQMVIQSVTAQLRAALDGLDDCSQDEAIDGYHKGEAGADCRAANQEGTRQPHSLTFILSALLTNYFFKICKVYFLPVGGSFQSATKSRLTFSGTMICKESYDRSGNESSKTNGYLVGNSAASCGSGWSRRLLPG